ncbi:MAG: EAL domain-containing protein [Betaproteobacteria bacterium]|nr:EAL domain-containing protein [Betaproteobacteria bacterium]
MSAPAPRAQPARELAPRPGKPCNCSALAELVDYVSDRLPGLEPQGGEPMFSARSGRLYLRGDRVEAAVGPFTLSSLGRRIVAAGEPSHTRAWSSSLQIRSRTGSEITDETLIRLQTTDTAAVAMDRLFRTLHMLNHLACAREDEDLWLPISLRHLLAVAQDHGAFFEDLLRRCGLGPARIVLVLQLPALRGEDSAHLLTAVQAYRARGFRLALALFGLVDQAQLALIDSLAPCALKLHPRDLAITRQRAPRIPVVLSPADGAAQATLGPADLLELEQLPPPAFLI